MTEQGTCDACGIGLTDHYSCGQRISERATMVEAQVSNSAMPKVEVYPVCSECRTPYVLRHALFVFDSQMKGTPNQWVWRRDCKHKKAPPGTVYAGTS